MVIFLEIYFDFYLHVPVHECIVHVSAHKGQKSRLPVPEDVNLLERELGSEFGSSTRGQNVASPDPKRCSVLSQRSSQMLGQ